MKNQKIALGTVFAVQSVICSILSVLFWNKKRTLSAIFAGAGLVGGLASLFMFFGGKCKCCKNIIPSDDSDSFDDESLVDEDIFCDFESDAEEAEKPGDGGEEAPAQA